MVHYYCFFKDCGKFSPNQIVFKVKVGSSQREQIKLKLLENFAEDCGYYLRRWDDTTDSELILRSTGAYRQLEAVGKIYSTVLISITKLYQSIINGTLETIKPSPRYLHNHFQILSVLYPAFRIAMLNPKSQNSRQPRESKYLSPREETQLMNLGVSATACVILFILGALLEGLERCM